MVSHWCVIKHITGTIAAAASPDSWQSQSTVQFLLQTFWSF